MDVKGPIPDLDWLAWAGRRVIVSYDADAVSKELVRIARSVLAAHLRGRGAVVGFLEWDISKGTGNAEVTGSTGGIARWCERRMFPVFPPLFPVCSHSRPSGFLKFPVFWISWSDLYGRNALLVPIYSTTRNTGNSGNRVETAGLGLGSHAEQTWNTGNEAAEFVSAPFAALALRESGKRRCPRER
jgi:hypothetical protein